MSTEINSPGNNMEREVAEVPGVFATTVVAYPTEDLTQFARAAAFYTIARGSSDAVANILSYEFMDEFGVAMTSLPPSVFSLGKGVDMTDASVLMISQSGGSDDLVLSAQGARAQGASVVALTNVPGSPVERQSDVTIPINAGPENAVPATKTVIGSIAAGMALLAAVKPEYAKHCETAAAAFSNSKLPPLPPRAEALTKALIEADNVYIIGRGAGYGAAHEVALKLKETCAIHAEAYSASEVLHGPLQLVTKPLTVLILDTGEADTQPSLGNAETRFRDAGAKVFRLSSADMGAPDLVPAAAAAILLYACYPVILNVSISLGLDPDTPDQLAKVTRTV